MYSELLFIKSLHHRGWGLAVLGYLRLVLFLPCTLYVKCSPYIPTEFLMQCGF